MKIQNFAQADALLKAYIPAVKEITGKDITLQRMPQLMKLLGNPEAKLKIIHIAGTSGKTSTAYYLAALLQGTGKKVGLTVSPHIMNVAERVQINLQPLSEPEFCARLSEFLRLIKKADPQPTYFELIIAFAYWYFAQSAVDYAVIETGLGGLHDATNIARRSDKVCVITDIGYDHTKVLGSTLTQITAQKAGIIHKNNEVFCYRQSPAIMRVLRSACNTAGARLHEIRSETKEDITQALPLFQRRNWNLAYEVFNFISECDGLPSLSRTALAGTMAIRIPARMEIGSYKGKVIIIDGAHNPQKLKALLASIQHSYPDQPIAVMAAFVQSRKKRLQGNLRQLVPAADHLIITSFIPNQEMYTKSADPENITRYCQQLGFDNWLIEPNPQQAFTALLRRPEPILLVTGSFYLMHHVRPFIMKQHD